MKGLVFHKGYGGSEVLEFETIIRVIHGNSTSLVHKFLAKGSKWNFLYMTWPRHADKAAVGTNTAENPFRSFV